MQISGDMLLIAIGAGVIVLIVILVILLASFRRRKNQPVEQPDFAPQPEGKPEPPPEPLPVPAPAPVKEYPHGTHIWRDPETGKIFAEIDGDVFGKSKNLDPEQRRKLVAFLREVAAWFGDSGSPAVSSQPAKVQPAARPQAPVPPPPPRPAVAAQPQSSPRPAAPSPLPPAAVQPAPAQPAPGHTAPLTPVDGAGPGDVKKTAPFSIVSQIDAILQDMLENSPMKTKGIRLVEDPRNGVIVWVGIQRYPGIDAVTDPEALTIIRAAVAEWERRAAA